MSELFTLPPSESPRLAWMKRHGVSTRFVPSHPIAHEAMWVASNRPDGSGWTGDTEDEAIVALAKSNGWPLWNEEQPVRLVCSGADAQALSNTQNP